MPTARKRGYSRRESVKLSVGSRFVNRSLSFRQPGLVRLGAKAHTGTQRTTSAAATAAARGAVCTHVRMCVGLRLRLRLRGRRNAPTRSPPRYPSHSDSYLSRQEKAQPEAKTEHQRASEVGVILSVRQRGIGSNRWAQKHSSDSSTNGNRA